MQRNGQLLLTALCRIVGDVNNCWCQPDDRVVTGSREPPSRWPKIASAAASALYDTAPGYFEGTLMDVGSLQHSSMQSGLLDKAVYFEMTTCN
jgi:hypothetical protein